jgi:hypothetical protein
MGRLPSEVYFRPTKEMLAIMQEQFSLEELHEAGILRQMGAWRLMIVMRPDYSGNKSPKPLKRSTVAHPGRYGADHDNAQDD